MPELYGVVIEFDRGTNAYVEMTREDLVEFHNNISDDSNSKYVGFKDRADGTTVNVNSHRILFVTHSLKEAE